mgnify:CR=1 FL=1
MNCIRTTSSIKPRSSWGFLVEGPRIAIGGCVKNLLRPRDCGTIEMVVDRSLLAWTLTFTNTRCRGFPLPLTESHVGTARMGRGGLVHDISRPTGSNHLRPKQVALPEQTVTDAHRIARPYAIHPY